MCLVGKGMRICGLKELKRKHEGGREGGRDSCDYISLWLRSYIPYTVPCYSVYYAFYTIIWGYMYTYSVCTVLRDNILHNHWHEPCAMDIAAYLSTLGTGMYITNPQPCVGHTNYSLWFQNNHPFFVCPTL